MSYNNWQVVIWFFAVADLGLALSLVRRWLIGLGVRRNSATPLIRRNLRLSLILTLYLLLKVWLFLQLVPSRFGLVHMLYLDLVVVLPCVALATLWWLRDSSSSVSHRRLMHGLRIAGAAFLLMAPVGVYASYVEPFDLHIERATLSLDKGRSGNLPIRVTVLADIQAEHITSYEFSAIDRAMALHPDIILIPGDVHQDTARNFASELPKLRALFAKLQAPGGVFLVQGDTDHIDRLHQIVAGNHVKLLVNEIAQVKIRDRLVTIGGLQLRYRSHAASKVFRALESGSGSRDIRILLTHRPDPVLTLKPHTRIDITVAGHTHGGQINPPVIDPPITLSDVPRWVAAGGLHDVGKRRRVYVSRGIGVERGLAPRVRFGAPPEISVITLGG